MRFLGTELAMTSPKKINHLVIRNLGDKVFFSKLKSFFFNIFSSFSLSKIDGKFVKFWRTASCV